MPTHDPSPRAQGLLPLFGLGYVLLLAYGTLYPLRGWHVPVAGMIDIFRDSLSGPISRADLLLNLLVYMPLGVVAGLWMHRHLRWTMVLGGATLLGFTLSTLLETMQAFLPGRTPALLDIAVNTLGTAVGAALPLALSRNSTIGRRLRALRRRWVRPGQVADLGLVVLGLWALSQLSPLVPSLDVGNLRQGVSPLYRALIDPARLDVFHAAAYAANVLGLGLVAGTFARVERGPFCAMFAAFVGTVLLLKIPIVTRQLSLEAALGAATALACLPATLRTLRGHLPRFTAAALVAAYALEQLRPSGAAGAAVQRFEWALFEAQMLNIHGLSDILATTWPFAGLACLAMHLYRNRRHVATVASLGAVVIFAFAFGIEWLQQYVPGRYPDISDAVVALIAWSLPWLALGRRWRPPVPRSSANTTGRLGA